MTRQLLAGLGYAPFRSQKQGYHFIIPPVENHGQVKEIVIVRGCHS